jgi:hypothetical protein
MRGTILVLLAVTLASPGCVAGLSGPVPSGRRGEGAAVRDPGCSYRELDARLLHFVVINRRIDWARSDRQFRVEGEREARMED